MTTRPQTIADLCCALSDLPGLSTRKMFGEYACYLGGKVVALVCNDILYIKATTGALGLMPNAILSPPYPGAKPHISFEGALDDPDLVAAALQAAAADLPEPKPKAKKTKGSDGLDHHT